MTSFFPNNRITLLKNGETYFPAIESAIDEAVHEIYLESYIFKNDAIGQKIAEALRRAALRGVRTRILIDGFGSKDLPETMMDYLVAAGIMLMKFRPKTSPWTLRRRRFRRLHRKIVVIDRRIAFVGGINIIDDMEPGQPWPRYDYAVCIKGPLVKKIHASVRRVWSRVAWTRLRPGWVAPANDGQTSSTESTGRMHAAFLVRNNIRHRRDIENAYLQAIKRAQSEIILANAYFFPGFNFRHALLDAVKRGVRVILLLQGKVEYRLMHYASHALYGNFLYAGVEIYEYHKSLMHAKVAVIDGHWATVGSSNLDPFSLLLALEANIVVDDKNFAQTLKHSLEQSIQTGARRVSKNNWNTQTIGLRLVGWLCYGLIRFMIGMTGYASGNPIKRPNPKKEN